MKPRSLSIPFNIYSSLLHSKVNDNNNYCRIDVVPNSMGAENDLPPLSDPVSATRVLCGALLLPTIANLIGKVFFDSVKSNFHRTILGGLSFIAVKGALRIYHKQQRYIRQCQRKILDYTESNISTYIHHNTNIYRRGENNE